MVAIQPYAGLATEPVRTEWRRQNPGIEPRICRRSGSRIVTTLTKLTEIRLLLESKEYIKLNRVCLHYSHVTQVHVK
jgi:hypothetical protein